MNDGNKAVDAYIALGSNMDNPEQQLKTAVKALKKLEQSILMECSSFYQSAAMGQVLDQPDFINAVCRIQTSLEPRVLLQRLQDIEQQQHRRRSVPVGGPRTLDLDILLYGDSIIKEADLLIPHPRLHERAFVLYPLAELNSEISIPGQPGLHPLLDRCRKQRIRRMKRS